MRRLLRFLLSPVTARKGGGLSLTRLCAFAFAVAGCVVALRHPSEAATVVALVGGGAVAILTRERGGPHA